MAKRRTRPADAPSTADAAPPANTPTDAETVRALGDAVARLAARGAVRDGSLDAWIDRARGEEFSSTQEAVDALAALRFDAPPSRPSRLAALLRTPDLAVPVALTLALAVAVPARHFVLSRRARAVAAQTAARAAAQVAATTPPPAPPSAPAAPADAGPPRPPNLDEATLGDLQRRLTSARGSATPPVWIAIAAGDATAPLLAERLQGVFERAGWRTHPIARAELRARPGLFVFSADERAPTYVDEAIRALNGAGLTTTTGTGYRAYYTERRRTNPAFRGVEMAPDQTWVIAVGRGE